MFGVLALIRISVLALNINSFSVLKNFLFSQINKSVAYNAEALLVSFGCL